MKTVAIIQARMSSSRFPGKVLADLRGRPMILFMLERVQRCRLVDEVAVATSVDPSDDPLASVVEAAGYRVLRGDLNDVLGRYLTAARAVEADVVIRLTGDCPLLDPEVVDRTIALRSEADVDYASNIDPPSFPDGMDCEVFTRGLLERAGNSAVTSYDREHVTPWMRRDANGIDRANLEFLLDASALRLTVDHADDLAAIRAVLDHMPETGDLFDILRVLQRHPEIRGLNVHGRNEGSTPASA